MLQLPVGGNDTLGRERVKNFTYDYAYWSVEPSAGNYASQEKVRAQLVYNAVTMAIIQYPLTVLSADS